MLMSSMVLRASWLTPTGILQPPKPLEPMEALTEKKNNSVNSVEAQLSLDAHLLGLSSISFLFNFSFLNG